MSLREGKQPSVPACDPPGSAGRLRLLDGFQLRCQGREVTISMSAQRLLVFLALRDRPVLRSAVAGALWLDSSEEQATASLRSALWRLRRPGYLLVEGKANWLRLADDVHVDYREVAARARGLVDSRGSSAPPDLDGTGLERDLLPDWWDEWVLFERERFRQLRLHALEALCARLAGVGRFAQAVEAGMAAVECEPLRETAHRLLIQIHLVEGNRAEALRQYPVLRASAARRARRPAPAPGPRTGGRPEKKRPPRPAVVPAGNPRPGDAPAGRACRRQRLVVVVVAGTGRRRPSASRSGSMRSDQTPQQLEHPAPR